MAVPKQKTSKERKRKRRSHLNLTPTALTNCPQCGNPRLPHHVCPTCGTYAGREVVEIKAPKKKAD